MQHGRPTVVANQAHSEKEIPMVPRIILAYGFRASTLIFSVDRKMASSAKSYSQSLRAIGQALEILQISAFTLEKKEAKYVIRDWEQSLLKSIAKEVWGTDDLGQSFLP